MTSSPIRHQLVGQALRRYRQRAGFGLEDAARVLECHTSKVSRVETGQRGIRGKELRELLAEYGLGAPEQATLTAIAKPAAADCWWQDYDDLLTGTFQEFLALEMQAATISVYAPHQVPDLLQTPDYTRAVTGAGSPGSGTPDRIAEFTLAWQRAVLKERQPAFTAVIDETVLHSGAGRPDTVQGQLLRLAEVSESSPGISVQILPFGSRPYTAGGDGPATILQFTNVPGLGVVYLAGLGQCGVCLVDHDNVVSHLEAFTRLTASALTPLQSVRLLRQLAETAGAAS